MLIKVIPLLFYSLLVGCTTGEKAPIKKIPYSHEVSISPKGRHFDLNEFRHHQIIEMVWGERSISSTVVLQNKNNELALVALNPMGTSLFEAQYKQGVLNYSKSKILPPQVDPKYILFDILLVYLTTRDLEEHLQGPLRMVSSEKSREFFMGNMKIIEIRYSPTFINKKKIKYINYQRNYKVNITILKEGFSE